MKALCLDKWHILVTETEHLHSPVDELQESSLKEWVSGITQLLSQYTYKFSAASCL